MENHQVTIHVRFAPNGEVVDIGDRPVEASAQGWFNFLSVHKGNCYQPLSGGRGVFKLSRADTDSLKNQLITREA